MKNFHEKIYNANMVIVLNSTDKLEIIKSRFSPDLTFDQYTASLLISKIVSSYISGGTDDTALKLFYESIRMEIQENCNGILEKHKVEFENECNLCNKKC